MDRYPTDDDYEGPEDDFDPRNDEPVSFHWADYEDYEDDFDYDDEEDYLDPYDDLGPA